MNERGKSKLGLTAGDRGWYKRIGGRVKWIASYRAAPTAHDADILFSEKYKDLSEKVSNDAVPLKFAVDSFILAKKSEVSEYMVKDYRAVFNKFVDHMGERRLIDNIGPAEFSDFTRSIAHYGISQRTKIVGCVRTAFNWWIAQDWLKEVRYGPMFVQPTKKQQRIDRAKRPRKLFTPAHVNALIETDNPMLKAAVLLGINGGLGNTDISRMTLDLLDGDLIRGERGKTGASRIVPLWPMTMLAIKALKPNAGGLLFYDGKGKPLESLNNRGLGKMFADLCDKKNIPRLGFYTLRRTFRTVTDAVPDRRAVELVMGHVQEDMGSVYVQEVHLDRLKNVTACVYLWLTGQAPRADGGIPFVAGASQPIHTPEIR